jgi:cytochrome b561
MSNKITTMLIIAMLTSSANCGPAAYAGLQVCVCVCVSQYNLTIPFTHVLFYILLIGIPLTGWLATPKFLSEEEAIAGLTLFGAFPLPGAPSLGLPMKGIHEIGSNLGIALLALHVLAALKHHFINRDDVLRRMLPFGRSS